MATHKASAAGSRDGEGAGREAALYPSHAYSQLVAERRVEDASRRVAEQIRVVAEIEAAGDPSECATTLLQELEQELRLVTERRDSASPETLE